MSPTDSDSIQSGCTESTTCLLTYYCVKCHEHVIGRHAIEDLYFILGNPRALVIKNADVSFGILVHCAQCDMSIKNGTIQYESEPFYYEYCEIQSSIDLGVLFDIEKCLGQEVCFSARSFKKLTTGLGIMEMHEVFPITSLELDEDRFKDVVQRVDSDTKQLVAGDFEGFFGFEIQKMKRKCDTSKVLTYIRAVKDAEMSMEQFEKDNMDRLVMEFCEL